MHPMRNHESTLKSLRRILHVDYRMDRSWHRWRNRRRLYFSFFGAAGIAGFNIYSLIVVVIGSVIAGVISRL